MSDLLLVRPSQPVTPAIARLVENGETLRIFFPEKRDDFREVVKRLQYKWEADAWYRHGVTAAVAPDRMAEAVRDMLAAGFCVKAPSAAVEAAVAGQFTEEPRRIVYAIKDGNYQLWWMYGEDCEAGIKKLPGVRWSKTHYRTVTVPAEQYAAVRDFAEIYGFTIKQSALDLMEAAEHEFDAAVMVNITPRAAQKRVREGKPAPLPDTAVEIDNDLLDI